MFAMGQLHRLRLFSKEMYTKPRTIMVHWPQGKKLAISKGVGRSSLPIWVGEVAWK